MKKILTVEQAIKLSKQFRANKKSLVLAGGCFDILHVGHVRFLERAKAAGDVLFVFLEGDGNIRKFKGDNRPFNIQADRGEILSALLFVDYVIALEDGLTDAGYDSIVTSLAPDVIAVTKGDLLLSHKERQAKMVGARVVAVTDVVDDQSTSRLAQLLGAEL